MKRMDPAVTSPDRMERLNALAEVLPIDRPVLLGLATGGEGFVEAQEARGQRELVASEQFPTDAPIADLEALGFTFGPVDERDPLFRPTTLPEGWRREGSDHAMWSYILDDRGRRRVAIFYKAAFYDRRAYARVVRPAADEAE